MRRNSKQDRERERAGDAKMFRAWKKFHREEREAALAGPHGVMLAELFRMFENLSCVSPIQLIGFARSIDWAEIDSDTRLVVLHEANTAISHFRETRGEEPIDDALPHEPLRVFQLIRSLVMNEFPASAGESPSELIRQNSGVVK
jgi:hypothetical protein